MSEISRASRDWFIAGNSIFGDVHFQIIFNESALRPIHSISRDVRLSVCGFVGHTLETTLPEGLETSGRMAYR